MIICAEIKENALNNCRCGHLTFLLACLLRQVSRLDSYPVEHSAKGRRVREGEGVHQPKICYQSPFLIY